MTSIFDSIANYRREDGAEAAMQAALDTKKQLEEGKALKPSEKLLQSIGKAGYSMDPMAEILRTNGDMLIVSCAGSGKTTTLLHKILMDLTTGELTKPVEMNGQTYRMLEPVWVSTFLKSGADELKATAYQLMRKYELTTNLSSVRFSTMHAEFKQILNAAGIKTDIIDDRSNTKELENIMRRYSIGGARVNSEQKRDFQSALTYTRNRIDSLRYNADIYHELGVTPDLIDAVLGDWSAWRRANEKMDFEDLQDYVYQLTVVSPDPKILDIISKRYKYLYIDEFQDTSQVQYEIIKVYSQYANKTIAIGDDDQTIYTWRGSANHIITTDFKRDYQPTSKYLEVNYRCPSNVLNPIIPSIERNVDRLDKVIKPHREGGQLRLGSFTTYASMVKALHRGIEQDIAEGKSVAVVCRQNIDGLVPAMLLDRMDSRMQYSISGDRMTLDSYSGKQIMSIIHLITSRNNESVKRALGQLVYDARGVDAMHKYMKSTGDSIWTIDMAEVEHSQPRIAGYLKRWRAFKEEGHVGVALAQLILTDYRNLVYHKDSNYNEICRSIIDAVLALITSETYADASELLHHLEDINDRLKGRKKLDKVNIRIATVHEFKGKEADSVYVWNDSEGVFPTGKISSYTTEQLEEERRVHYIACTRALERSTIISRAGKPGIFLQEMDLSQAENFNIVNNRSRL